MNYNEKLDSDRQILMEEKISSMLFCFQEGQIRLDESNSCNDHTLTQEDCQDISKQILYTILQEFRPDLFMS